MAFTNEQLERYSRHIILKEVGVKGQKKLLNAKVLIIGAGGLGAPAAMYLAAAGVGTIGIADADVVDLSNLQRQIIHATEDVNKPKVQSAKETIEKMNPDVTVNTYRVFVNTFDEYLHMLDICTQITGQRDHYQTYGLDVQAQVDAAKAEADGSAPTVLFLRAGSNGVKVKNSKDTVLGAMLADLGAVNIADSDTALLEDLSLEQIMADDPQYIFAVYQGSDQEAAQKVMEQTLTASPAWNSLTAVQEGRYYVMDKTLYHLKPTDRWGEAYQRLADILYGGN